MKNYQKAIVFFNKAYQLNKKDIYKSNMAICYIRLQQFTEALFEIEKAIQINPHVSKFYRIRGYLYVKMTLLRSDVK